MKELSIEQKARRYDEAIERANSLLSGNQLCNAWIYKLLPELAESEDERIRKDLIIYLRSVLSNKKYGDKFIESWIAWLERQGEKPNNVHDKELSEILGRVIRRYINDPNIPYSEREEASKKIIPYVERLEKQGEQKPAEWTEEDEENIDTISKALVRYISYDGITQGEERRLNRWLKSLKDRYTWKPIDEQMEAMQKALVDLCGKDEHNIITGLYYDLKKLRGE